MHPSWKKLEDQCEREKEFAFERIGDNFFPEKSKIFMFSYLTPFPFIKAVIIGQDPYYSVDKGSGRPKAQGYCFGSHPENSIPASLNNIFKELDRTIVGFQKPKTPDLRMWTNEGVLMYNMALTVERGNPNSHSGCWKPFSVKLIKLIDQQHKNLVFFLWGRESQKLEKYIASSKHKILKSSHPSPLSATKGKEPFIGNGHFVKCNEYLIQNNIRPIDWRLF